MLNNKKKKMDFDNTPNAQGVYKITHIETNNFYIGCSRNIKERFLSHFIQHKAKLPRHILHIDMKKYGISTFLFEILEVVENESDLFQKEFFLIKELNPYYNILVGGKINERWRHLFILYKNTFVKPENVYKKIIKEQALEKERKIKEENRRIKNDVDNFLTVKRASELLGLSQYKINTLIDSEKIKHIKPGGTIRISKLELDRYISFGANK